MAVVDINDDFVEAAPAELPDRTVHSPRVEEIADADGATSSPTPASSSEPVPQTPSDTSATSTPLQATARAGMEPSELAELSRALGKRSSSSTTDTSLSQTARRRIKLDQLIENVTDDMRSERQTPGEAQSMMAMLLAMEERHAAREAEYRRERERYERQREARESVNQQMLTMLVAQLVGGKVVYPKDTTNQDRTEDDAEAAKNDESNHEESKREE
ncbi:hypothetical protein PHMEG_00027066 [Phytophthora megakarya]|uniref:Uncharacterized protein n=1 Tax=Phytophthora megakarya TaxID=4795 RepID=A0A225V7R9_9STRA|nr:hypothetical protein PHMEG_00027066 [Phytophthora megakarya]